MENSTRSGNDQFTSVQYNHITLSRIHAGVLCRFSQPYQAILRHGGKLSAHAKEESVVATFPTSRVLDDLNYKAIMIGFPLLTIGIITDAAWTNYAWGTYWSCDPKETWSLIVWFLYAAFSSMPELPEVGLDDGRPGFRSSVLPPPSSVILG